MNGMRYDKPHSLKGQPSCHSSITQCSVLGL
nr:MAG TPA: hypothetical protein [Caudoviricetes sp.]